MEDGTRNGAARCGRCRAGSSGARGQKEKRSYALGMDLGIRLRAVSIDVDPALVGQGLKDALSGSKTLLTDEEVRATVAELRAEIRRKEFARRTGAQDNNPETALLAENKKKEGVVTLPSGLQYKILKAGEGKKPTLGDTVVCHYRGTLLDGTGFDRSYKRNQPMTFPSGESSRAGPNPFSSCPLDPNGTSSFLPNSPTVNAATARPLGPTPRSFFEVELLSIQPKR